MGVIPLFEFLQAEHIVLGAVTFHSKGGADAPHPRALFDVFPADEPAYQPAPIGVACARRVFHLLWLNSGDVYFALRFDNLRTLLPQYSLQSGKSTGNLPDFSL